MKKGQPAAFLPEWVDVRQISENGALRRRLRPVFIPVRRSDRDQLNTLSSFPRPPQYDPDRQIVNTRIRVFMVRLQSRQI